MTDSDSARLAKEVLDPILVDAGFLAGQGGNAPDGSGQLIYCIRHDDLLRRYPHLPQADEGEAPGRCDDLVVDLSADGTIDRLDLEAVPLAATLGHVGLDTDADAVMTSAGRPVAEGLPLLEAALRRLFGVG